MLKAKFPDMQIEPKPSKMLSGLQAFSPYEVLEIGFYLKNSICLLNS